jgi:hypothetical protein
MIPSFITDFFGCDTQQSSEREDSRSFFESSAKYQDSSNQIRIVTPFHIHRAAHWQPVEFF